MRIAGLDIAVFGVYFAIVIALGYAASRRGATTKRDYFLAGDKLPWWMVGGSIVAANVSSHHFVGVMGVAYTRGFVAMTIEWGAILVGFNALLWVFLPFYLRNGFYTMPEFLERRFGSAARSSYAALILLTYVFVEVSAVLYLGALAIHALLGVPILWSIVGMAVFTGIYTIAGGLRAVVWTEMLQLGVLLAGGIALSIATIRAVGGWGEVMATSSDWHLLLPANDADFPWTMFLGGIVCISVFYCAANQFIVQRTLAAKDEWHARMGVVFTDYLKFLMPLIIIVPGLVAPTLFPNLEKGDMVFPTLVRHLLPAGLVGLVMAGLIAAIMSHISGAVNSCTTIATVDLYLRYFRKGASDREAILFGKVAGAVFMAFGVVWAATLIAHSEKPVFIYLLNAYGYFTPGIATMFLLGILWRRTTHAGALTAGALTIPLSVVLERALPGMPFMNRTGIAFWACMLACAVVSLCTKPKTEAELAGLIWNRDSLRMPVEMRERMRGIRSPALWWAILTAVLLAIYVRYR
ncbi:MAG: sodium/solute symporter [Armatimonadetes bacterium]|nr:sodium/solute symporter [Armatimonadota bacterium]